MPAGSAGIGLPDLVPRREDRGRSLWRFPCGRVGMWWCTCLWHWIQVERSLNLRLGCNTFGHDKAVFWIIAHTACEGRRAEFQCSHDESGDVMQKDRVRQQTRS